MIKIVTPKDNVQASKKYLELDRIRKIYRFRYLKWQNVRNPLFITDTTQIIARGTTKQRSEPDYLDELVVFKDEQWMEKSWRAAGKKL